jgi:hypothetical protein
MQSLRLYMGITARSYTRVMNEWYSRDELPSKTNGRCGPCSTRHMVAFIFYGSSDAVYRERRKERVGENYQITANWATDLRQLMIKPNALERGALSVERGARSEERGARSKIDMKNARHFRRPTIFLWSTLFDFTLVLVQAHG